MIRVAFNLLPCIPQRFGDLLAAEPLIGEEGVEGPFQAARSVSQRITSSMAAMGWP